MREANMMTVAAHIAEWFNPGSLIIRNKHDWRIMKYIFSIIQKNVVCPVVSIYSISVVSVKTYITGSIDIFLL
jgi:hypothetical protein